VHLSEMTCAMLQECGDGVNNRCVHRKDACEIAGLV
jgi:hypothetical protein